MSRVGPPPDKSSNPLLLSLLLLIRTAPCCCRYSSATCSSDSASGGTYLGSKCSGESAILMIVPTGCLSSWKGIDFRMSSTTSMFSTCKIECA